MADKENDAIRTIMLESANVQLAALKAGITFWQKWVEVAGEFSKQLTSELDVISRPEAPVDVSVGRLTDSSLTYLRRMTELSTTAMTQFQKDLEPARGRASKRARSTRAKE